MGQLSESINEYEEEAEYFKTRWPEISEVNKEIADILREVF